MKKLKISDLIAEYYDDFTRDINEYYLDTQTGEIIPIDSMLRRQRENEGEITKEDLPQWQQDEYDTIMAVLNDVTGKRYKRVPSVEPGESFDIMRDFARTVQNDKIADELFNALHGPKSFRRFRDVLRRYDQVRNDYYDFRKKRYLESLTEWLNDMGIEPEWGIRK